jgi:peptide deformylase
MVVRPIRITGDPVLHTKAQPVTHWDQQLADLVADMVDTMRAAPGVGLAAPQIGVPLRVFVWEWTDGAGDTHEGHVINPTLSLGPQKRRKPHPDEDEEGCLSVPDFRYALTRAESVVLQGVTLENTPVQVSASGWLARIFQHEYDHLEGVLYVDRLPWRTILRARREIKEEGFARPGLAWMPGVDRYEGSGEDPEEA